MGQITKVQKSKFKAGDIVVVERTGSTYSTYKQMAEFLGLTNYIHGRSPLSTGPGYCSGQCHARVYILRGSSWRLYRWRSTRIDRG